MKTIEEAACENALIRNKETEIQYSLDRQAFKKGAAFAQRWISVKDELPEKMQWVIAMKRNGLKLCLYYNDSGNFVFGQLDQTKQITHWRPLEFK